ncbi:unnamed protein product, partial [Iphiclides podalirius]
MAAIRQIECRPPHPSPRHPDEYTGRWLGTKDSIYPNRHRSFGMRASPIMRYGLFAARLHKVTPHEGMQHGVGTLRSGYRFYQQPINRMLSLSPTLVRARRRARQKSTSLMGRYAGKNQYAFATVDTRVIGGGRISAAWCKCSGGHVVIGTRWVMR